jgi:uncharacterized membrane protein YcaP (DUF421 family)
MDKMTKTIADRFQVRLTRRDGSEEEAISLGLLEANGMLTRLMAQDRASDLMDQLRKKGDFTAADIEEGDVFIRWI